MSRLAGRSKKRAAMMRRRALFVAEFLRYRPRCLIGWPGCYRKADSVHERWKFSATGPFLPTGDPDFDGWQFVPACKWCNDQIENEPVKATVEGWSATFEEAYRRFPAVVSRLSKVARQREQQERNDGLPTQLA